MVPAESRSLALGIAGKGFIVLSLVASLVAALNTFWNNAPQAKFAARAFLAAVVGFVDDPGRMRKEALVHNKIAFRERLHPLNGPMVNGSFVLNLVHQV